jgi:hypothetical protein
MIQVTVSTTRSGEVLVAAFMPLLALPEQEECSTSQGGTTG